MLKQLGMQFARVMQLFCYILQNLRFRWIDNFVIFSSLASSYIQEFKMFSIFNPGKWDGIQYKEDKPEQLMTEQQLVQQLLTLQSTFHQSLPLFWVQIKQIESLQALNTSEGLIDS